jgi:hypothetical protein
MPSTAGELFVDLEALDGVQRELTVLINALNELGVRPAADGSSMGSEHVADAVHRFVTSWDSGRSHLLENLQACQRFAQTAVEHYTQTENALQSAMEPTTADGNRAP